MDNRSKAKGERNDCVVRAFEMAFQVTYNEAHTFVRVEFKRKPKKGTFYTDMRIIKMVKEGRRVLGKSLIRMPVSQKTILTFSRKFPEGNYLIMVAAHAVGISNGRSSDHSIRQQRIKTVYKVV